MRQPTKTHTQNKTTIIFKDFTGKFVFRFLPNKDFPVDTGRKLNVHKTFSRCPAWKSSERLMYVQFTSCVYGVIP